MCQSLVRGIRNGTISIVSDGSFNATSPIGSAGISAVILALSTTGHKNYWTKGWNWVTSPEASQSAYRSELAGVISSLTILDIFIHHHNITDGAVTIALDGKTAMDKSRGDWPLSIDQKCFDYLQVIRAWIKLSPLTFTFIHVKGDQTDKVAYNQLDWWGKCNKDIDLMAKDFLHKCTEGSAVNKRSHIQPTLHLENGHLHRRDQNLPASAETHYIPICMTIVL